MTEATEQGWITTRVSSHFMKKAIKDVVELIAKEITLKNRAVDKLEEMIQREFNDGPIPSQEAEALFCSEIREIANFSGFDKKKKNNNLSGKVRYAIDRYHDRCKYPKVTWRKNLLKKEDLEESAEDELCSKEEEVINKLLAADNSEDYEYGADVIAEVARSASGDEPVAFSVSSANQSTIDCYRTDTCYSINLRPRGDMPDYTNLCLPEKRRLTSSKSDYSKMDGAREVKRSRVLNSDKEEQLKQLLIELDVFDAAAEDVQSSDKILPCLVSGIKENNQEAYVSERIVELLTNLASKRNELKLQSAKARMQPQNQFSHGIKDASALEQLGAIEFPLSKTTNDARSAIVTDNNFETFVSLMFRHSASLLAQPDRKRKIWHCNGESVNNSTETAFRNIHGVTFFQLWRQFSSYACKLSESVAEDFITVLKRTYEGFSGLQGFRHLPGSTAFITTRYDASLQLGHQDNPWPATDFTNNLKTGAPSLFSIFLLLTNAAETNKYKLAILPGSHKLTQEIARAKALAGKKVLTHEELMELPTFRLGQYRFETAEINSITSGLGIHAPMIHAGYNGPGIDRKRDFTCLLFTQVVAEYQASGQISKGVKHAIEPRDDGELPHSLHGCELGAILNCKYAEAVQESFYFVDSGRVTKSGFFEL